jgi:ABC-type bacteriocin/lantibiotic exporter with double-glycine peptidase domain
VAAPDCPCQPGSRTFGWEHFGKITYGESASIGDAKRAASLAEAHEFIAKLPQGYETIVGYHGASLSAGQRQRIALARALVRDPEVLIVDEATNTMQCLSEAAIVDTLRSRARRRTTIVIRDHRSTISFCDDVVILGEGRVANQAPFAESHSGAWISSTSTKRTKPALLYAVAVTGCRLCGGATGRH